MLRTTSFISLSAILKLLINAVDEDEVCGGESGSNKINLSNLSALKKSTKAGYLTSRSAKKGGNNPKKSGSNIKKDIKAPKSFNYLTPNTKKAFNHLQYMFTQASILQYFNLK